MSAVQAERLRANCHHPSTISGLTSAKVPLRRRSLCGAATTSSLRRATSASSTQWATGTHSEVLSYLAAHEAIAEVRRYAEALSPEGVVAISMINDGKSRAIWRALREEFRWIDGILWQQKEPWPSYRISVRRGRPGYLVGVLGSQHSSEGRRIDRELALKRRAEQDGRQQRQYERHPARDWGTAK